MCQIIDQDIFSFQTYNSTNNAQQKNQQTLIFKTLFQDDFSNIKIVNNKQNNSLNFTIIGLISFFIQNLSLLVEIHSSQHNYQVIAKIIENNRVVTVAQNQMRKSISKQLRKKIFTNLFQNCIMSFCIDNGQWYIKSPIIYLGNESIKQFKKIFQRVRKKLMDISKNAYINISKLLNQTQQQLSEHKKSKLNQIFRYYYRCTIQPSISIKSDCAQYQSVMNRYAASRLGLQDLIQANVVSNQFGKDCLQSLQLYGLNYAIDFKSKYLDEITLKQKQKIQEEIFIPSFASIKSKENKFIYNHCYFFKRQYQQVFISKGGNSQVYALKPQLYEYTSSNTIDQKTLLKSEILSKYVIKHVVYKKNIHKDSCVYDKQNRLVPRQNQIVSYLRGASCIFLPKYYLNIQKQSSYQNKLFIDYIPGQTLDEFLLSNSLTISLLTKLYILLQVLQSLRFISQYGIVHLDIKEQNIIVMKKIVCKLFDFSESYHYKVCGSNHKPKYTLLYACPQVVTSVNGRVFTQKSDTYSLGVMMHKILFNRYPFIFPNKEKFQKCHFDQKLRQKTFYCPQQMQDMGYGNVIHIINQMIFKCMEFDETKRPFLDWQTIIFKCCLNYITSQ